MSTSRIELLRWGSLWPLVFAFAFACQPVKDLQGAVCTDIGCEQGVRVDFSYRDAGTYVFEVIVDGVTTTCTATIPLPRAGEGNACDRPGIYLGLVGSLLSIEAQSVGGIILETKTASSIRIRGTRDDVPLGDATQAPPYRVGAGPNGPGCEPTECKLARYSFP